VVAKYGLQVDDAVRAALDDAKNESCKPGDPAFARAQFELMRGEGFARRRDQTGAGRGYAIIALAPISKARPATSLPIMRGSR